LNTHLLFNNETGNTLITLGWITIVALSVSLPTYKGVNLHIGKDQEDISFTRIGNPHLGTAKDIVIVLFNSTSLKSKSIRTGTRFGQTETTNRLGGQFGEESLLDIGITVLANKGTN